MTETCEFNSSELGVFHLPSGCTLRDAAERLSRMAPDRFRTPSAFAFIFDSEITDSCKPKDLSRYDTSRPYFVVDFYNGTERLRKLNHDRLDEIGSRPQIDEICKCDLMDLMTSEGTNCILEPGGNYHFVTPALLHTDRFIRIGDLVRSKEGLDRLAFWMRRTMNNTDALLVDTWSISSIALRAILLSGRQLPFDCLPEHPTYNTEKCDSVINNLVNTINGAGRILILVSISGSGRLIQKIRNILAKYPNIQTHFISLFGFNSTPPDIHCLARIDNRGITYTEENCNLCQNQSIPIQIDSSSYHINTWREHLVSTAECHFDTARDFINNYRDTANLFWVHRNDQADSRHHAFDIDVNTLLDTPSFIRKHIEITNHFKGNVDLIISPLHSTALRACLIASEILKVPFVVHDTLDPESTTNSDREALNKARSLLIVDDTVNSGSRIQRYIQSIREGNYGSFSEINVHVALARTETGAELKRLSDSIRTKHPWKGCITSTEQINLPRWNSSQCPWCKEFDFFSKLAELYPVPPTWLTKRLSLLGKTSQGLTKNPLFILSTAPEPNLGRGSVICKEGTTPMPVLFAVASALQQHRSDTNLEKQLFPGFPLANVLDHTVLKNRFTEGLIRATFLRCLTRSELGVRQSAETWKALASAMIENNQTCLRGELLVSLGRRIFPTIEAKNFQKIFEGFLPETDLEKISNALSLPEHNTT